MCEICMALGTGPVCGTAPTSSDRPLISSNGGAVTSVTGFEERFKGADLANMQALVSGVAWNATSITYSFPDSTSDYGSIGGYGNSELASGFGGLNLAQQNAARASFQMVEAYTKLSFTERTSNEGAAQIRLAESSAPSTAWAYYPSNGDEGGDAWFNGNGWYDNPQLGTYAFHTFMHEIGHALGLKHGHDPSGYGALDSAHDQMPYSIMTYRSYEGASGSNYTNEFYGYAQSFMAYDIAALQALYGANWDYQSGDTTYSFSQSTGEMSINGVGQGAPQASRIFQTIWDAGGTDTINISNFSDDVVADLNSGGSLAFSSIQRAQLGGGTYADANLYLAISPNNKAAGLIDNVITGSGADNVRGNKLDNRIETGDGRDKVFAIGGDDFIFGGADKDTIVGGPGDDVIDGGFGNDRLKGSAGADIFVLDSTTGKDVARDFAVGVDFVDVPNPGLATLTESRTGHLTIEYEGSFMILRRLDFGDHLLEDLII